MQNSASHSQNTNQIAGLSDVSGSHVLGYANNITK